MFDEASHNLLKSCLPIAKSLKGSNKEKKGRQQKRRGSVVKCSETPFDGERVLVKIVWDSPCVTC